MARQSNQAVDLVVDALASYRVTRLLVSDGIVDRQRHSIVDRLRRGGHSKLVELSECPWCIGFWVACGVVAARRAVPRAWSPVAEAFAFSAVSGLLATEVRSLDDTHDVTQQLEQLEPVDDVQQQVARVEPATDVEHAPDTARLFRRQSGRA
jgi:hypothetical protein